MCLAVILILQPKAGVWTEQEELHAEIIPTPLSNGACNQTYVFLKIKNGYWFIPSLTRRLWDLWVPHLDDVLQRTYVPQIHHLEAIFSIIQVL
jgi:hypothetical protein